MKRVLIFFLLLFWGCSVGYAGVGDTIWTGCGATCDESFAGSATGWVRTIETSGCSSGECLKLDADTNGQGNCGTGETRYGAGNTSIGTSSVSGYDEITVVYKVKFDQNARNINDGNIKGIRPLQGCDTCYTGTSIDVHFGRDHYSSSWDGATLEPNAGVVTFVNTNVNYCVDNLDGTYDCPDGRLQIKFTVDGKDGYPANTWREQRKWIKLPTSDTSADGEIKMWIDDTLVYHLYNIDQKDDRDQTFSNFRWYPSSEACDNDFEHWMDEMIIYEGYVPPGDEIPTLNSATIDTQGTSLTLIFSEAVTQGSGYNNSDWDIDCSVSGNNISVTYSSGNGTTSHVYTIAETIYDGETCDIDFNGDANSEEDSTGNDLAAIVSGAVVNDSEQYIESLGDISGMVLQ
jgi:hypothetical protein